MSEKQNGECIVCRYEGRVEDFWGELLCAICAKTPVGLADDVRATISWTVRLLKPKPRRRRRK